jgi:tRNA threonylcarbamoyladenosine biosynthesis protein TsaE
MTRLSTTPSAPIKGIGAATPPKQGGELITSESPEKTFSLGERIGSELQSGDVVLLYGDLGAGKTLLTKGILSELEFDVDEVTSPSFTLVNLYKTSRFDVYHIDLWRVEGPSAADTVGLDEIVENVKAVTIIEWADRLGKFAFPNRTIKVEISGDGDEPRLITIVNGKS